MTKESSTMASTPVGIPGLGRMTDEDDGYLTLQFVNEAAAEAFMAFHDPTVDTRDMPPYRLDPANLKRAAASLGEQHDQ
jgi:hypothetical protein